MANRLIIVSVLVSALLQGITSALGPPWLAETAEMRSIRENYLEGLDDMDLLEIPDPVDSSDPSRLPHGVELHLAELPIDHFAACSDTYQNRYWVQGKYYKRGGPVMVFDGGEGDASGSARALGNDPVTIAMLKKFGAIGIEWEHRYYGKSIPDRKNRTWLTIEQALADLPALAANFSLLKVTDFDLTPASTPWIMIGASYPGVRSAWSREKYPETFHAAWAGSAPVQARVDNSVFFVPMIEGMKSLGHGGCLADHQAAVARMDRLLADKSTAAHLKRRFFGEQGHSLSAHEFGASIAIPLFTWQWYPRAFSQRYCDIIELDPDSGEMAPPEGWAPTKGADWVIDRMTSFRSFRPLHANDTMSLQYYDGASWAWQYCSQFGFLQCDGPELHHLVPAAYSLEWRQALCHRAFPGQMPSRPHAQETNDRYGGWNARPSNVFWTGGEMDGWRSLGPLNDLPGAPHPRITTEVPDCGVSTGEGLVFGAILPNGSHTAEFYNTKAANKIQLVFHKALEKWLPGFEVKSKADVSPRVPPKCPAQ